MNPSSWESVVDGVVEFPDGRRVRGRGLGRVQPSSEPPAYGLYLLATPPKQVPWEAFWIPWPDFGLPLSTRRALTGLLEAHRRCVSERVEVACAGGRGRTGTALAVLATMSGVPAEDAVAWVRRNYRSTAVETPWQRRWVQCVARRSPPR